MFHNKHALKQFGHQLVSLGSLQNLITTTLIAILL